MGAVEPSGVGFPNMRNSGDGDSVSLQISLPLFLNRAKYFRDGTLRTDGALGFPLETVGFVAS
jgi:hypothetical protein